MMEREFVIAAFGDRTKQVSRLVHNIRQFVDYPINILTTHDSKSWQVGIALPYENVNVKYVERIWPKGTPRADICNSNYHKIKFAIDHHYHSLCMLDDDMYILGGRFEDGFAMAEKFGAALPINPRTFTWANLMGAGVTFYDWNEMRGMPLMSPAVNFSPFFVRSHSGCYTTNFLLKLRDELKDNSCRGTIAIFKAMWRTAYTPVILPEQWCVCCENSEYIKNYSVQLRGKQVPIPTIMLHLGHDKVKEVFKNVINDN